MRPMEEVTSIIVHTTGDGPVTRMKRHPGTWPDPFETAIEIYRALMNESGPHYLVGQIQNQIAQMCPESFKANHVKTEGSSSYAMKTWSTLDTSWWHDTFPLVHSPVLLTPNVWVHGSCNRASIGIEVSPDPMIPRGHWSDKSMQMLLSLILDIRNRRGPLGIFTHSQVHPLHRSHNGRPWDPNPNQWNTFCEFAQGSGLPLTPYSS